MDIREQIEKIDSLSLGFQHSQILFTALRAGVFPLLDTPRTAPEMAQLLGWSERGTRMLLNALAALELLTIQEGQYQNTETAANCLVSGAPGDQTHIAAHRAEGWAAWSRLAESVRTGGSVVPGAQVRNTEQLRAFICGMSDIARHSAQSILDVLDLSPYHRLLDLGAGPGSYSIAFLERHPEMWATLFDRPEVLDIAREEAGRASLEARMNFMPGDLLRDTLPPGHDLMLLSNILHSFGPDENESLVSRCYAAIEPGGLLIIKDFLLDNDSAGPAFGLLFALQMLLHTPNGDTYSAAQVAEWTSRAGFSAGELLSLTPHTRLWLVRK